MTVALALRVLIIVVGVADMFLVAPALKRAAADETAGRLLATLLTLAGIVLGSIGRLRDVMAPPPPSFVGLACIAAGLIGYAVFLPQDGIRGRLKRRRTT